MYEVVLGCACGGEGGGGGKGGCGGGGGGGGWDGGLFVILVSPCEEEV